MLGDSQSLNEWLKSVQELPGVLRVELSADQLTAVVASKEEGRSVREAARQKGIPDRMLAIKLMRYWLEPFPDDPEKSQELLNEQGMRWSEEEEAEEL